MVLGIKLEIDKASVKNAAKQLRGGIERGGQRVRRGLGLGAGVGAVVGAEVGHEGGDSGDKKKKGKKGGKNGALGGALLGGFAGAIIGSLKPVQELLSVIAGILQLFLVPILILLKPFLVLFLKVGIALLKAFSSDPSQSESEKKTNKIGTILGVVGAIIAGIAAALAGAPALLIAAAAIAGFFLVKKLFEFGVWLGDMLANGMRWAWDNVIKPVWEWLGQKLKSIGAILEKAWSWIKDAASLIWSWFLSGLNKVINFFSKIPGLLMLGLNAVVDFFKSIPNLFMEGLKFLANLGERIWKFIKSSLIGLVGGSSSQSVDDALISSSGQITRLNPNDNVLAFQDFSQVQNVAGASGGFSRGGSPVSITVNGFVGNDQDIADKISKAMSKSTRGSVANFG